MAEVKQIPLPCTNFEELSPSAECQRPLKIDFSPPHLKRTQNVHIVLRVLILAVTRSSEMGPGQFRLGYFHPMDIRHHHTLPGERIIVW